MSLLHDAYIHGQRLNTTDDANESVMVPWLRAWSCYMCSDCQRHDTEPRYNAVLPIRVRGGLTDLR